MQLDKIPSRWTEHEINLGRQSLSADYEFGNILSVYYPTSKPLDNQLLKGDLTIGLDLYRQLVYAEDILVKGLPPDEDEVNNPMLEDYTSYRLHRRIERNPKLTCKVKELKGYTCEACGFDYRIFYPGIKNSQYIEAHHLAPVSSLKGRSVNLDPRRDFAVLCANCHRMIHRFTNPGDIAGFRSTIK